MASSRSSYDPSEDIWNDDEESQSLPNKGSKTARVVDGINIKDLCDGKEVMFQISKEGDAEYVSEEENDDDDDDDDDQDEDDDAIIHCDPKVLREKRGAPSLNTSFSEISSKMTNVDDDGCVKKQLVTSGAGKIVPDRAYVTVHYNLYKESCELPFDSTYMRNRPEKFRLDQGEAILGLEIAIKSMKKNENSMFFIKWEVAFGAMGCPDRIGPKCDIVADVTVINYVEVDPEYEMSSVSEIDKIDFQKCLNKAKQLCFNGSDEYAKGETRRAVSSYRKALKILRSLRLADEPQEALMLKQKVKCLVNLAVCYNKLGRPEQACVACQEALSIDQNNVKANFHYGRANISLSNFTNAKKYLLRADKLKPHDKDINTEIKKLNDKKALYDFKDKMFWGKVFNQKEEKKETEELPDSLKTFEKTLMTSLEGSIKEEKPYILPMPLRDDEKKVCDRVATQMNLEFQTTEQFLIFKKPKNTFLI